MFSRISLRWVGSLKCSMSATKSSGSGMPSMWGQSDPDVAIGDEVVLWGQQGDERITNVEVEELAPRVTNAYRMTTRTRTYLPRIPV